jgi:hypothetical protein
MYLLLSKKRFDDDTIIAPPYIIFVCSMKPKEKAERRP